MKKYNFPCGCSIPIIDEVIKQDKLPSLNIPYEELALDLNYGKFCPEAFKLIGEGQNKGVFQLESYLGYKWGSELKPDNVEELAALVSLIRPACLNALSGDKSLTQKFVDRKHGREEVTSINDVLDEILEETYGVLCIHEDTMISLNNGLEKPIKEIKVGDKLNSIEQTNYSCIQETCDNICISPNINGIKITLENNWSIVLTEDHKIYTQRGAVKVNELNQNDVIQFVKKQIYTPTTTELLYYNKPEYAYLCGQLVGDGCSGEAIASGTKNNHDKLFSYIKKTFSDRLNIREYFNVRSWYIAISGEERVNEKGFGGKKTKYRRFVEALGLDKTKNNKIIPDQIMTASSELRHRFLAGLFDSDGHTSCNDRGYAVIHYCTSNKIVLEQLRKLLSLDGIHSYIDPEECHLYILNKLEFNRLISPYLVIKTIIGKLADGLDIGSFPKKTLKQFVKSKTELSLNKYCKSKGLSTNCFRDDKFAKISTVEKLGYNLGDIVTMRIKKMEYVYNQRFYSISVSGCHNLIGNGIVISNCYQESAMQIAMKVANYSEEQADLLRKCLSADSTFETSQGTKTLLQVKQLLDEGKHINVYTVSNGQIVLRPIKKIWKTGILPTFKITTTSDYIRATENHKLKTTSGWTKVKDLQVGDELIGLDKLGGYTVKITDISAYGEEEVYDFEMDAEEHWAFVNGILAHNSIGKKDAALMSSLEKPFMEGCKETAIVNDELAKELFEWIRESQQYSFNKCLTPDTMVELISGELISLDEVSVGSQIKTPTGYATIKNKYENGKKNVVKVTLESGKTIKCTIDHKFLCDDDIIRPLWEILQNQHRIISEKITSVEIIGCMPTMDIEIDSDDHIFYGNGIATSNSHAVSYSYISYLCAFTKHHFPLHFYASWLAGARNRLNKEEEIRGLIAESKQNNFMVKTPTLGTLMWNDSDVCVDSDYIRMGLQCMKKIGHAETAKIRQNIHEKEKVLGPIKDWSWTKILYHLLPSINSQSAYGLITGGVLTHKSRTDMLDDFNKLSMLTKKQLEILRELDLPLQDGLVKLLEKVNKPQQEKIKSILQFFSSSCDDPLFIIKEERALYGVPLSLNPSDVIKSHITPDTTCQEFTDGKTVKYNTNMWIGGEVQEARAWKIKNGSMKGKQMASFKIQDQTGTISCVVFPDIYEDVFDQIYDTNLVIVGGYRSKTDSLCVKELHMLY